MNNNQLGHIPNFLDFIQTGQYNLMATMINCREEFDFFTNIDGLFRAAMAQRQITEDEVIIFQLLTFCHYHLLFSFSSLARTHSAEAFNSVRVAIDAALIAHKLISEPHLQANYIKREPPFDKLLRLYKNKIKDKKESDPRAARLVSRHDHCSQYASHADFDAISTKLRIERTAEETVVQLHYFLKNGPLNLRSQLLVLLHDFVVILDVFGDWLIDSLQKLPPDWRLQLQATGKALENHPHFKL